MSRPDNVDALEKQLASLQMAKDMTSSRMKKIPPAVPPKKKGQPQVPQSAMVNTIREPSYSMKISPILNSNSSMYSNLHLNNASLPTQDYANVNSVGTSQTWKQNLQSPSRSQDITYSNIPPYRSTGDNLPRAPSPPPPPVYVAVSKSFDSNHNHEDILPPPSPVSSNYSELVRATGNLNYNQDKTSYPPIYQNDYPEYGISQVSTYESLYEPINPRPQSNLSVTNSVQNYRSNEVSPGKSLYDSINPRPQNNLSANNLVQNYISNNVSPGKSPLPKEEEVDALTNLLVQSISDSQDLDVFGICIKCNEKVVGENSGCSAMGNMYHVKCFCCHRCRVNLQGKPFYAVEGQPFCESDYYETLEKCSVCNKPILDRILRATGKPYHPACFTCVACGISLDGIPFTVDAMNQIHCIEDFHKKFAPRCCVCNFPIMPEEGQEETVRVVALDRSFHVKCYRCEDCGMLLSSEAEGRGCYPLDDHILCKNCNGHRIRMLTNVMTTDL